MIWPVKAIYLAQGVSPDITLAHAFAVYHAALLYMKKQSKLKTASICYNFWTFRGKIMDNL